MAGRKSESVAIHKDASETGTASTSQLIKKSNTKSVELHSAVTVPITAAQEFINNLLSRAVDNELAGINAIIVKDVEHKLCSSLEQFRSEFKTRSDDTMPAHFEDALTAVCEMFVHHNMYALRNCNSKQATNMQMSIRMLSDSNIPATVTSDVSDTILQQQYESHCEKMCDSFRVAFGEYFAPEKAVTNLTVHLTPAQKTLIISYAHRLFAVNLPGRDADMNKLIVMLLVMHETVWRCTDNIHVMIKQLTLLIQNGKYNVMGAIGRLNELLDKLAKIFVRVGPHNYKTYVINVRIRLNDLLKNYAIYVSADFMKDIKQDKLNNNEFVLYNKTMAESKKQKPPHTYKTFQTVQRVPARAKFKNSGKWEKKYFVFSLDKGMGDYPSIFKILRGDNADVTSAGCAIKLVNVKWTGNNDVTFNLKFSEGNITSKPIHYTQDGASEADSASNSASGKRLGNSN